MNLRRQIAVRVVLAGSMAVMGASLGAQTAGRIEQRRLDVQIAIGGEDFPKALSQRCQAAAASGRVAVVLRPRGWVVLQGDTQGSVTADLGCGDLLPAPVQVAPDVYESPWGFTEYSKPALRDPQLRSEVRLGLETPPGWPLVRATAGGGLFWALNPIPIGSAAIGIGTRGPRVRLYAELERNVSRIAGRVVYWRQTMDGQQLPPRVAAVTETPRWTAVRLGVDVPLRTSSRE